MLKLKNILQNQLQCTNLSMWWRDFQKKASQKCRSEWSSWCFKTGESLCAAKWRPLPVPSIICISCYYLLKIHLSCKFWCIISFEIIRKNEKLRKQTKNVETHCMFFAPSSRISFGTHMNVSKISSIQSWNFKNNDRPTLHKQQRGA